MTVTSDMNPSALQGTPASTSSVLGELSPSVFLRDYWQKRPLLIRQAIPGFKGIIDRSSFIVLAEREDAMSRLVIQHSCCKKSH